VHETVLTLKNDILSSDETNLLQLALLLDNNAKPHSHLWQPVLSVVLECFHTREFSETNGRRANFTPPSANSH